VADAMRAGRAYRFGVLGVPGETLAAVVGRCSLALG
jgi:hypothetical protein